MRTFICALLLIGSSALILGGCTQDVAPEKKVAVADPPQEDEWQWEEGSSYDPGYWPKWKNPCPGPACDPPTGLHPEWLVDPPPDDYASSRMESAGNPSLPPAQGGAGGTNAR